MDHRGIWGKVWEKSAAAKGERRRDQHKQIGLGNKTAVCRKI